MGIPTHPIFLAAMLAAELDTRPVQEKGEHSIGHGVVGIVVLEWGVIAAVRESGGLDAASRLSRPTEAELVGSPGPERVGVGQGPPSACRGTRGADAGSGGRSPIFRKGILRLERLHFVVVKSSGARVGVVLLPQSPPLPHPQFA